MAIKTIDDVNLKQIANAIREKTGSAEGIAVEQMPGQIRGIQGSGTTLPELENEGTAADLLSGKQLINGDGNVVTGSIATFDGSYECSGDSTGGGSGSGGASVETCTVNITGAYDHSEIWYECVSDGQVGMIYKNASGTTTLTNVLCGGLVICLPSVTGVTSITGSDSVELCGQVSDPVNIYQYCIFRINAASGEQCAIIIASGSGEPDPFS